MAISESIKMQANRVTIQPLAGVGSYVGIQFIITPTNTTPIEVEREMFYVSLTFEEDEKRITITHPVIATQIVKTQPITLTYYPEHVFTKESMPIKNPQAAFYYHPKEGGI